MKRIHVKRYGEQWNVSFLTPDRHSGFDYYIPLFSVTEKMVGPSSSIFRAYRDENNDLLAWSDSLEGALRNGVSALFEFDTSQQPGVAESVGESPRNIKWRDIPDGK